MGMSITASRVLVSLALLGVAGLVGAQQPTDNDFLRWSRQARNPIATLQSGAPSSDLEPLNRMIGMASIVALSEAVHDGAEPLEFRNRLFEYLVETKGFTAIAIESGTVEGRKVYDYVRGGAGDLSNVMSQGISWGFDELPQNEALVKWIRAYNARPGQTRKVSFYGFDVSGSPGDDGANRTVDAALLEAMGYLRRVDPAEAASFDERLSSSLKNLRFEVAAAEGPSYGRWSRTDRDALTATIVDLIALLERREAPYITASSREDYSWAYRAAINARQTDIWLRQFPVEQPAGEAPNSPAQDQLMRSYARATEMRDRAQADNLDWIIQREGANGKVLVYGSRYHLSMAEVTKASWWPADPAYFPQQVAGTYLKARHGERLVTIGNLISGGTARCADFNQTLEAPPAASMDGLAARVGPPLFLLDLRAAPPAVSQWLNQDHLLGYGQQVMEVSIGKAFDILFYVRTVTPACP